MSSNCRKCGKETATTSNGLGPKCAAAYFLGLSRLERNKLILLEQDSLLRNVGEKIDRATKKKDGVLSNEEIQRELPEEYEKMLDSADGVVLNARRTTEGKTEIFIFDDVELDKGNLIRKRPSEERMNAGVQEVKQHVVLTDEIFSQEIVRTTSVKEDDGLVHIETYDIRVIEEGNEVAVEDRMESGEILSSAIDYRPSVHMEVEFARMNPLLMDTDGRAAIASVPENASDEEIAFFNDAQTLSFQINSEKVTEIKSIKYTPPKTKDVIMATDSESACAVDSVRKVQVLRKIKKK